MPDAHGRSRRLRAVLHVPVGGCGGRPPVQRCLRFALGHRGRGPNRIAGEAGHCLFTRDRRGRQRARGAVPPGRDGGEAGEERGAVHARVRDGHRPGGRAVARRRRRPFGRNVHGHRQWRIRPLGSNDARRTRCRGARDRASVHARRGDHPQGMHGRSLRRPLWLRWTLQGRHERHDEPAFHARTRRVGSFPWRQRWRNRALRPCHSARHRPRHRGCAGMRAVRHRQLLDANRH